MSVSVPQKGELFLIVSADNEWALTSGERVDGHAYVRPLRDIGRVTSMPAALWELLPAGDGRHYIVDQRHRRALVSFEWGSATHRDLDDAIREGQRASCWLLPDMGGGLVRINEGYGLQRSIVVPKSATNTLLMQLPVKGQAAEWRLNVQRPPGVRERFVEPSATRYWTLAGTASTHVDALYLRVQNGSLRDGAPLVFGKGADDGAAHFRLAAAGNGGFRLINRESGKIVRCSSAVSSRNPRLIQGASSGDADEVFRFEAMADGSRQVVLARDPRLAIKAGGVDGLAGGSFADLSDVSTGGTYFQIQPAFNYKPPERPNVTLQFDDEPFDYNRAVVGGIVQLGAHVSGIPGAGAVLGLVFGKLWPDKKQMSYDLLKRFREDIMRDVEAHTTDTEFNRARNLLKTARQHILVDYTTAKRTGIDVGKGHSDATLATLEAAALSIKNATAFFVPAEDKWNDPLPAGPASLLAAGMPLYLTSRVEHLAALAEAAMLQSFDTRRAVRVFLRNGRMLLSGDPARSHALDAGFDPATALEIVPLGGGAIGSGDSIALRCSSNDYVSLWRDANADVTAIGSQAERYETFCIERIDAGGSVVAGDVKHGDRVTFTATNGLRLMAANGGGGGVHAVTTNRAAWETFTVVRAAGAGVLRAGDAVSFGVGTHFLSALDGGGRSLSAAATGANAWETFAVVKNEAATSLSHGTRVALRQHATGNWLSALDGGGHGVAMTDHLAGWEIFTLEASEKSRALGNNDPIALRTQNGHYLVAAPDGKLRADSATSSPLALEVVPGTGAETISQTMINGFVADIKTYVAEVGSTVARMLESLCAVRTAAVELKKRHWTEKTTDGRSVITDDRWQTTIVDTRRNGVLMDDDRRAVYDDPKAGLAELDAYRKHLRWDYANVTYPASESIARLESLADSVDAACRRLSTDVAACTRFRYAALLAGIIN